MNIRVGFGYDVHQIEQNRELWIGGVQFDEGFGLKGHSDADVLIHAICDALLGAANLRDIGFHFPDNSSEYENIDSKILLKDTYELIKKKGYDIGNIDATICAEQPKMNPKIPEMQNVISKILSLTEDDISIKATTSEKMGFVGREQGMAAYAVVLIYKKNINTD